MAYRVRDLVELFSMHRQWSPQLKESFHTHSAAESKSKLLFHSWQSEMLHVTVEFYIYTDLSQLSLSAAVGL